MSKQFLFYDFLQVNQHTVLRININNHYLMSNNPKSRDRLEVNLPSIHSNHAKSQSLLKHNNKSHSNINNNLMRQTLKQFSIKKLQTHFKIHKDEHSLSQSQNEQQQLKVLSKPIHQKKLSNLQMIKNKLQGIEHLKKTPFAASYNPIGSKPTNNFRITQFQKLVGQDAVNNFYARYKQIERIKQKEDFIGVSNPLTLILAILQNYNIPPRKMSIIKRKGAQAILDLKNCGLGNGASVRAITQIVGKLQNFVSLDLSANSIKVDLVDVIIPKLFKLRVVSLAYNRIGKYGCQQLGKLFKKQNCEIQQLNLESNMLTDSSIVFLLNCFSNFHKMKILNLSRNNLSHHFAVKLKDYLMNDDTLMELYLHWNQLSTKSSKFIFEAITNHKQLRVLDMSWNNLGGQSLKAMCDCIKKNKTLLHLDISYSEISYIDSQDIAKALKSNHTIYGIHYQGNQGFIDSKGFLQLLKKKTANYLVPIRRGLIRRITSIDKIQQANQYRQKVYRDVCWICEGWVQSYFKVEKTEDDLFCYIHFDFERYQSLEMNSQGLYFDIIRMCPPTKFQFFITKIKKSNSIQHKASNFYQKIPQKTTINTQFTIGGKKFKDVTLQQINEFSVSNPKQLFSEYYQTSCTCQPRTSQLGSGIKINSLVNFQSHSQKKKKNQKLSKLEQQMKSAMHKLRTIPEQGQFYLNKDSGKDSLSNQFAKKCVDFDIENSKFNKIVRREDERQQIRRLLEENYYVFSQVFYHLASSHANHNSIFFITQSQFEKFIQQQGYQSKRMTKAKIRLKMYSSLSNIDDDGSVNSTNLNFLTKQLPNSSKLFSRPQFFEFLVRLTIQKWCKIPTIKENDEDQHNTKKQCLSIRQGFQKMINSLQKYHEIIDEKKWRNEHLYTYDCSQVIKGYVGILQRLYDKYAGFHQKNFSHKGKKKMLLNEFKAIFLDGKIRQTKQSLKQAETCFLLAKRLEIQDGKDQLGLQFDEFIEALARYAQILNLLPVGTEEAEIWKKQNRISHIPYFLTLQTFLHILYMNNRDLRTKKLDKFIQNGIFQEQTKCLLQLLQDEKYSIPLSNSVKHDMSTTFHKTSLKFNTLDLLNKKQQKKEDDVRITLKKLVEMVRDKYQRQFMKMREQQQARQKLQQDDKQNEKEQLIFQF